MKKYMPWVAMSVIVFLGMVFAARAQGPALPPGEYELETGQYVFNVPELALTDTPIPGPTETPVPPSPTPEGVPLCAVHDDSVWHALLSADGSCHYNDEHGMNPHDVDDIFGTTVYDEWGSDLLPPWAAGLHGGHTWMIWRDNVCEEQTKNCVVAGRHNFHLVFASGKPFTVRFHSGYRELLICDDLGNCGIKREGGMMDTGRGLIDGVVVALPDDDILPFIPGNQTRKIHKSVDACPTAGGDCSSVTWYTGFRTPGGFNTQFGNKDVWGPSNPDDLLEMIFFCPAFDCANNGSRTTVGNVNGGTGSQFSADENGIVNVSLFTDILTGEPNPDCTGISPVCAPFENIGVPEGGFRGVINILFEGDVSPPGEFWIEFPN